MTSPSRTDPEAGRRFFARGPLFACALAPPDPAEPRRCAWLAFAPGGDFDDVVAFARHAGGRHPAFVIERLALGTGDWPAQEPVPLTAYTLARGDLVVLSPSVASWVAMPPAQPHHLVQLVAALPEGDEGAARAALAAAGGCGIAARIVAVLHGDSGAEVDAVTAGPEGLRVGWFPASIAATSDAARAPSPAPAPDKADSPAPPLAHDAVLNGALVAWLAPFPRDSHLAAWLRANAPHADGDVVRASLDALIAAASDALWNETSQRRVVRGLRTTLPRRPARPLRLAGACERRGRARPRALALLARRPRVACAMRGISWPSCAWRPLHSARDRA